MKKFILTITMVFSFQLSAAGIDGVPANWKLINETKKGDKVTHATYQICEGFSGIVSPRMVKFMDTYLEILQRQGYHRLCGDESFKDCAIRVFATVPATIDPSLKNTDAFKLFKTASLIPLDNYNGWTDFTSEPYLLTQFERVNNVLSCVNKMVSKAGRLDEAFEKFAEPVFNEENNIRYDYTYRDAFFTTLYGLGTIYATSKEIISRGAWNEATVRTSSFDSGLYETTHTLAAALNINSEWIEDLMVYEETETGK